MPLAAEASDLLAAPQVSAEVAGAVLPPDAPMAIIQLVRDDEAVDAPAMKNAAEV